MYTLLLGNSKYTALFNNFIYTLRKRGFTTIFQHDFNSIHCFNLGTNLLMEELAAVHLRLRIRYQYEYNWYSENLRRDHF